MHTNEESSNVMQKHIPQPGVANWGARGPPIVLSESSLASAFLLIIKQSGTHSHDALWSRRDIEKIEFFFI